jgi:hypothetical protein
MILLYVLEFTGIFILILLAALLFIPFNYLFAGRKYETASVRSSVGWIFGLVKLTYKKSLYSKGIVALQVCGLTFNLKPVKKAIESESKEKNQKKARKRNEKKNESQSSLRFLDKSFINLVFKAFIELLDHIKPKQFYLEGRFGFEDPYYTGITSAFLNILHPKLQQYRINARAVFDEEVLEGKLFISGRIVLVKAAVIALKLYFNKNFRNVLKPKEEKLYVNRS